MIKSFSGQVAFILLSAVPYLPTLATTDHPSIYVARESAVCQFFCFRSHSKFKLPMPHTLSLNDHAFIMACDSQNSIFKASVGA